MNKRTVGIFLLLAIALTACATQPPPDAYDPPGFFSGFIHGLTALFALFGSLLWDMRVYAFPNSGWWYDLGFMLGITSSGIIGLVWAAAATE